MILILIWSFLRRLEEEEKLVTAEGLYKRAVVLDDTFREAAEALEKLQIRIQVSWINLTVTDTWLAAAADLIRQLASSISGTYCRYGMC